MMEACIEAGTCQAFIVFTPGDRFSWIEKDKSYKGYSLNADATPFDDFLQPKPAFFAMEKGILKGFLPNNIIQ
jgi:hypothetical protein